MSRCVSSALRRGAQAEDDVGSVACAAFELAAFEVPLRSSSTNDGFDGGAAAQLALDDPEDAALLAGDEDAAGILRVVAAVSHAFASQATGEDLGARPPEVDPREKAFAQISAGVTSERRPGRSRSVPSSRSVQIIMS
jgi:hypothetical protein